MTMTATIFSTKTFGVEIEVYVKLTGSAEETLVELADAITVAGIECRAERYNHETRTWWKLVTDGSLREKCPSGYIGAELVSPPLYEDNGGYDQIKTACSIIAKWNVKILSSCGLHVHVGYCKPASNRVLPCKTLVKFYGLNEKWFDAIMPESRRGTNNSYCQTLSDHAYKLTEDSKPGYEYRAKYSATISGIASNYLHKQRYHKINLEAYVKYGTVEFRQHSGTYEAEKIINWVKVCRGLCEKSRKEMNQTVNSCSTFDAFLKELESYTDTESKRYLMSRYLKWNCPESTEAQTVKSEDEAIQLPF